MSDLTSVKIKMKYDCLRLGQCGKPKNISFGKPKNNGDERDQMLSWDRKREK